MKVRKDSFTYPAWEYWVRNSPSEKRRQTPNLCRYFWVVTLRSHFLRWMKFVERRPIIGVLSLVLAFSVVTGGAIALLDPAVTWGSGILFALLGCAFVLGVVVLVVLCVLALEWWSEKKPLQSSLIGEYAKAKKSKVCPIIEFEE